MRTHFLIQTHINFTSLIFALALCDNLLAFQDLLSVLVQFQDCYLAIRRVERNLHLSPIGLVLSYFVHMESPFLSVDLEYLALLALVVAFFRFALPNNTSHHDHLVVLPYRDSSHVVLSPEVLGQVAAHHFPANVGWGREMGLPALPSRAGYAYMGQRKGDILECVFIGTFV